MAFIPQRGDTGFTLGGFLILAVLGTFLWRGAPLDSVRPGSDVTSWDAAQELFQVPARLWQDPFEASAAYDKESGKVTLLPAESYTADDIEALSIGNLRNHIEQASKHRLNIILAMMSPGSYAEIEEQRRRRRFAVVSALGEESFVPDNPEALNVFYHRAVPYSETLQFLEPQKYPVSYEWFHYEAEEAANSKEHKVVVLWLDESRFASSPLGYSAGLLDSVLNNPGIDSKHITVTLLGPGRSDALKNLVNNDELSAYSWLMESGLNGFNILSSTATVDDYDLASPPRENPILENFSEFNGSDCLPSSFLAEIAMDKPCLRFLRTLQSDKKLIELLADELVVIRNFSTEKDKIIVISESDTYFGRSLPRAFTRAYCGFSNDIDACRKNLIHVSYQRGLDGFVAGEKAPPNNKPVNRSGSGALIDEADLRRPTGTAQYDYLRRLTADIREQNTARRYEGGRGIRAVILLGSDVYDKLLILRALRPELPGVLFVTTDLNTQLLHPAEYSWARNLIIATTYDLTLSGQIPMKTMPMRDSYQTSTYLATRLLFNGDLQKKTGLVQSEIYERLPAQLLEVGRSKLVKLSPADKVKDTWNLVSDPSYVKEMSLAVAIFALLGMFAFHQLKPRSGREIVAMSMILACFSVLTYFIVSQDEIVESVELFSGTSIWPTVYIRLFCILLSLIFIWYVLFTLNENWKQLGYRYFTTGMEPEDDGISAAEAFKSLLASVTGFFARTSSFSYSKLASVLMIIVLMIVMSKVMPAPMQLYDKLWMLAGVWLALIIIWWAHIYGWLYRGWAWIMRSEKRFHVRPVNKWRDTCVKQCKTMMDMWQQYGEYGAGEHRFMRTIAYILIYFAFASFVFTMLGSAASPCRGEFACTTNKVILSFAVLAMLTLLFLVVDAARLCICWVDSLYKKKLDWQPSHLKEYEQQLKLPKEHAKAWILVHLIGERTDVVTRLIYYPVIIILLMLLSRSTYFDNWDFPQALAIIVSLNFIIALGSVVVLNFVAQSARKGILRNLEEEQIAGDKPKQESYEASSSERKELIQQLSSLQTGAYLPVWQQPPVRATLMLLGGFALTFAEYFNVFLQ